MRKGLLIAILLVIATLAFCEGARVDYDAVKGGWGQDYGGTWGVGGDFRRGGFGLVAGMGFSEFDDEYVLSWALAAKLHFNKTCPSSTWLSLGASDMCIYPNETDDFQMDSVFFMLGYNIIFTNSIYFDVGFGLHLVTRDVLISFPLSATVSLGIAGVD